MIQKEHIADIRKDLPEIAVQTRFWRTAAKAQFDKGKWKHLGQIKKLSKKNKAEFEDEFLLAFDIETPRSYGTRMVLSNDFGYSKDIIEAYSQLERQAEKSIEITGLSADLIERFENNIDGNGTTWKQYFSQAFEELLKVGRIWGATDSFLIEQAIEPTADSMGRNAKFAPLSYMIPRENIRNFVYGGETFKFVTWNSIEESADGIKKKSEPVIIIMTTEEIAIARKKDNSEWSITEKVNIDFGYPPVRDASVNNDYLPIIDTISKLQFNLFNLDSEMRKGMRTQVGMALLEMDKSVKIDELTDTSIIKRAKGTVETKWVEPVGTSYESHFTYQSILATFIRNLSRLRSQKNMAETDTAKAMDFTMVEAVYNATVDAIIPFIQQQVADWGAFSGSPDVKAEINIERELDFTPTQEAIQVLLQELSAGLGSTAERKLLKMYRDKKMNLSPDEKEASDAEIDTPESNDSLTNSGDNIQP